MDRSARLQRQREVEALIESVGPRLLALPGVVTLGVGFKISNDQMSEDIVLRVGVEHKRPVTELQPDEVIPDQIDGIPTDVFESRPGVSTSADTSRYRPLVGGIQINNGAGGTGTLGCFAKRNTGNDWVGLSNRHVMYAGYEFDATIEIAQPGFSCCCCCRSGKIGTVLLGVGATGGPADAAICSLEADIEHHQEVMDIGGITGTATAIVGDKVRKRGRTTHLTTGVISMMGISFISDTGTFTNTMIITPDAAHPRFCDFGDSGSVVINEGNAVVGLIFAKSSNDKDAGAHPIAAVESALDITIAAQLSTRGTMPSVVQMPPPGSDGVIRRRDWEGMLWGELDRDGTSRKIAAHWNEVWALIQHNREVGLRWQRGQGPAFTAAFERTTRVTSYRVPDEIEGVSFTQLLLSMAAALERHGSEALRRDICEDAIGWLPALQRCRTADALWLEYQRIKQAQHEVTRGAG